MQSTVTNTQSRWLIQPIGMQVESEPLIRLFTITDRLFINYAFAFHSDRLQKKKREKNRHQDKY